MKGQSAKRPKAPPEIDIERLTRLYEGRGWTQGKLAQRSGVKQSLISMILAGERTNVTLATARKLADALHVHIDDLVVGRSSASSARPAVSAIGPLASAIQEAELLALMDQAHVAELLRLLVRHELEHSTHVGEMLAFQRAIHAAARTDPQLRRLFETNEHLRQFADLIAGRGDAQEVDLGHPGE